MLKKLRFTLSFALLGLSFLAVAPAQAATTIFTSFGSGFSNNASSSSFLDVNGTGYSPSYSAIAAPFTPTENSSVVFVDLLLGWAQFVTGSNNVVDVGIYSDSSDAPGTLLGEVTPVTVTATLLGTAPQVFTADIGGITDANGLIGGTQYWVVVTPTTSNTFVGWFNNQDGGTAPYSQSTDGSTWTNQTGGQLYFDVNGYPTGGNTTPSSGTPEPGTLALLGLGLGAVVLQRRRSSR